MASVRDVLKQQKRGGTAGGAPRMPIDPHQHGLRAAPAVSNSEPGPRQARLASVLSSRYAGAPTTLVSQRNSDGPGDPKGRNMQRKKLYSALQQRTRKTLNQSGSSYIPPGQGPVGKAIGVRRGPHPAMNDSARNHIPRLHQMHRPRTGQGMSVQVPDKTDQGRAL